MTKIKCENNLILSVLSHWFINFSNINSGNIYEVISNKYELHQKKSLLHNFYTI
jgi:hypothetical protein